MANHEGNMHSRQPLEWSVLSKNNSDADLLSELEWKVIGYLRTNPDLDLKEILHEEESEEHMWQMLRSRITLKNVQ